MKLINIFMKIAGKKDFYIDEKVSKIYIIRLCVEYGLMLIRGCGFSLFYKNISSKVFIGNKVKLYEKRNMTIGKNVKIRNNVKIDALSTDGVVLGDNVVLGKASIIECTGSIRNLGKGIRIGEGSTFGNDCFFGAAGGISIGTNVIAGQYIRFHSENHNYSDLNKLIKDQGVSHKGIKVGNNCWIGSGAVFLDGAEIGDGCVVAANSVVTKQFPSNSIIGGVPAKIIKMRNANE